METSRTFARPGNDGTETRAFAAQLRVYTETSMMIAVATGIGELMAPALGASAIDLLYLLPVMAAATLYGLRPGLFAGAASALAYNFFFTEPVHSLRVADPRNVVTVAMLFAVAVVTSQLAARLRAQARIATADAAREAALAGYARRLICCATPEEVGMVSCGEIAALFDCHAILLIARDGAVERVASTPPDARLDPNDVAAAAWVTAHGEPAGRGSPRLSAADWLFHPVAAQGGPIGAMGLARDDGTRAVATERLALLDSLLDQTALALARVALDAEMRDVAQLRERDRLRGALLSSVGHDLRTPLTAIVGAAGELRHSATDARAALIDTIEGEAGRLGRYIANLLDMARIEAGAIRLRAEPVDLVDAVAAATRDLRDSLAGHSISVDVAPDLPLVTADPELLHHCLINLLDNAGRYSAADAPIAIAAGADERGVRLTVADQGAGLPAEGEAAIFARFERVAGSDRKGGAGLGLAIVGGLAGAMGIGVSAANRPDRQGAVFSLDFPAALLVREPAEGAAD